MNKEAVKHQLDRKIIGMRGIAAMMKMNNVDEISDLGYAIDEILNGVLDLIDEIAKD